MSRPFLVDDRSDWACLLLQKCDGLRQSPLVFFEYKGLFLIAQSIHHHNYHLLIQCGISYLWTSSSRYSLLEVPSGRCKLE